MTDRTDLLTQYLRTCKLACELLAVRTRAQREGGWVEDIHGPIFDERFPQLCTWRRS